jgi:hypothetical protein
VRSRRLGQADVVIQMRAAHQYGLAADLEALLGVLADGFEEVVARSTRLVVGEHE